MALSTTLLGLVAALSAPALGFPQPHGGGWVPSGAWSSPSTSWPATPVHSVQPASPWPSSGWTDYNVGVDPWAAQKARYKANPAAWWASSAAARPPSPQHQQQQQHHQQQQQQQHVPATPSATSTAWFHQRYNNNHHHQQQPPPQQHVQYHHVYQHPLQLYQQPLPPAEALPDQYEYHHEYAGYPQMAYHLEPEQLVYDVPQVVKKKPSYASLYPWVEKPVYRHVPLHVPTPSHHHGAYAGWSRIPVVDEEAGNQWVAWVPEEFGDFVIVRKDKIKPKKPKKVVEEEEEEEPEPPKPKKKKVKTIVEEEEEAPEEPPKKKIKTVVEEEAPAEPKKTVTQTTVEDDAPKKTTKTTVTTEKKPSSVTKTEVTAE